ncbi:NAD(P)-binding domain-containing protein [Desertibacillus haloalkaliphilus]|uniref:NAD(P)-binding domain-containing protein n=1 Tax=Desertibacillus haloalkaliphilus TaxID=1328930 RepID=UPI001C268150|nr:FAD/NAD(P)-binding protein [Desertibacillus haloalkaliphilus]MBU8905344.1 lysine N(6)-hydroxylase/L-ornithine N(5)-oxygenase family protein [Desertibacillus haloalkaliphilus]
MYDWIIIGGGIHGCTVATFLIKSGKADVDKLLIIDPNDEPLFHWKRNTSLIGMEYLRSPSVHHIDINPFSLEKYGKPIKEKGFYGYYMRPSLQLFNEHCERVLKEVGVDQAWCKGMVTDVTKHQEGWRVETSKSQSFFGKNIVIAFNTSEQNIPEWAERIKKKVPDQVHHIFNERLADLKQQAPPITVVGGGITAAHVSITLSALFPGKVTLIKRHEFRVHAFDSHPGWLGPKHLQSFKMIKDYDERRKMIQQARNKGSIPKEQHRKLRKLEREGKLTIITDEISSATANRNEIELNLKNNNKSMSTNTILLATGFQAVPQGQQWLQKLITEQNLQCAKCGFPIVSESLEWCRHLYVSGPLAELEVGPVSRNISGARIAARKIVLNQ